MILAYFDGHVPHIEYTWNYTAYAFSLRMTFPKVIDQCNLIACEKETVLSAISTESYAREWSTWAEIINVRFFDYERKFSLRFDICEPCSHNSSVWKSLKIVKLALSDCFSTEFSCITEKSVRLKYSPTTSWNTQHHVKQHFKRKETVISWKLVVLQFIYIFSWTIVVYLYAVYNRNHYFS